MPHRAPVLAERLERLVQAGRDLTAEPSLDRVLQRIVDLALTIADARYAAIGLLAADRRSIEVFVTAGVTPEERALMGPVPRGRGLLGTVIREGHAVRVADIAAHPESVGFPAHHPVMRSFLGVPVTGRDGILGHLYLAEKAGDQAFTEADEHLCGLLAGMASTAVENARHHEESARLLADVQALLRSRERFFAMVNHEMRNSLAAVHGWAEMLVRRKDPASVPKAAFEVLEAAQSAVALINDLLDLSRLDEDRLKPVLRDVDCELVLQRATSKVTPVAEGKGIRIEKEAPPGLMSCHTDAHRVEQILVNLLTNAIRHSPAGTTVRLAVSQEPGQLLVRVLDEGVGISAENLDKVFDVYYTKAGEEGTVGMGLGLPLSRRLARLLGGDLTAANRESGGAVFTLRLPVPELPKAAS